MCNTSHPTLYIPALQVNSDNAEEMLQLVLDLFGDARVFVAIEVLEKLENFLKVETGHPVLTRFNEPATVDLLHDLRDKHGRLQKTLEDTETVGLVMISLPVISNGAKVALSFFFLSFFCVTYLLLDDHILFFAFRVLCNNQDEDWVHTFGALGVETYSRLMPDGSLTLKCEGVVDNCELIEQVRNRQEHVHTHPSHLHFRQRIRRAIFLRPIHHDQHTTAYSFSIHRLVSSKKLACGSTGCLVSLGQSYWRRGDWESSLHGLIFDFLCS